MRIGINGLFWGKEATGSGQYIAQLLRALQKLGGVNISLFGSRCQDPAADIRPVNGSGIKPTTLGTPFDRLDSRLAKVWFEQVAFPRACRYGSFDLAHVPYFAPPLLATVPTVVTIHDLIPLMLPEYRGSAMIRAYMRLVSQAARRADLVLTDSWASARDIELRLGLSGDRVRVIYLAANERFRPLAEDQRRSTLTRLGVPPRYFLYLGGFDRRKNLGALLRAFQRVHEIVPDAALVVAGRLPSAHTPFTPDPRVLSSELGLGQGIQYLGWIAEEDKPALYSGATAFVFPSYYEGFGLPVLEALSSGTPAIVGSGSSLEEVTGPGGVAVSPQDDEALSEAMARMSLDGAWRRELAVRGLEHAHTFSWDETARQTLAAYRQTLGE